MEKSHMHNILVKRCPKGRKLTHGIHFRDFVQIMLCHAWSIGILEPDLWATFLISPMQRYCMTLAKR